LEGEGTLRIIDYKPVLEKVEKRAILERLAVSGGEVQKSELESITEVPSRSLDKILYKLVSTHGIITIDNDRVKLRYKTPLCYIFDSPGTPYAYLGLLGERKGRSKCETQTAVEALEGLGFKFARVRVINTERGIGEWVGAVPSYVEWCRVGGEDVSSVERMESRIEEVLPELLRDYILIMDCTSLTVPATLAFFRLAGKFKIPLIYVYEGTGELAWVASKEDIYRELMGEKITEGALDYKSALENENKRRALKELAHAGRLMGMRGLERRSKIPVSTLHTLLEDLWREGIITREYGVEIKGKIPLYGVELRYKSPLCHIFGSPRTPYAYLGLLGERMGRSDSETETALKLLKKEGFTFKRIRIVTTHKGAAEWEGVTLRNADWHLVKDNEIKIVETMKSVVEGILRDLLRKYILILDCTSLTKPATIAYYKLAIKYKIPLVYVYEDRKELTWIISKEDLQKELLPSTEKED